MMLRALRSIPASIAAISTYISIRRTPNRFSTRSEFLAWQGRQLRSWLNSTPRHVARYKDWAAGSQLSDYPIIGKQELMEDFAAFNRPCITAAQGWIAFSNSRLIEGYHVGASTGTSGNRGLYVISEAERHAWLGAILAKTLPDIWKPKAAPERVAVILPLHTRLYDTANKTRRISMRFFDLTQGPDHWREDLYAFSPTILIAPPKILRWLSQNWPAAHPRRIYSGAEVLDPVDAKFIEQGLGVAPGQIYMATEGLIGVSCPHGRLHLCEDIMKIELDPVPGTNLVSPIITDFRRTTQVMLRYRMNDLLRLSPDACACGSPCLVVDEIVGRHDDVFLFPKGGSMISMTPDILRNAVVDADRRIQDFRIIQTGLREIELHLEAGLFEDAAGAAIACLHEAIAARQLEGVSVKLKRGGLDAPTDRKLRRVERRITP